MSCVDVICDVGSVTETDKANEKMIFDAIRSQFPGDELIGEVGLLFTLISQTPHDLLTVVVVWCSVHGSNYVLTIPKNVLLSFCCSAALYNLFHSLFAHRALMFRYFLVAGSTTDGLCSVPLVVR